MLSLLAENLLAKQVNAAPISQLSLSELEKKIASTEEKLNQLPLRLIRESGGTLGVRLYRKNNKPETTWVEVDLLERKIFDSIVLVPAVLIDENQESTNHAFPNKFQIWTYASPDDNVGELLFDSTSSPLIPYPDKTPLFIDCPGASARRIRIIPLELNQVFDQPEYIFAMSELLVFDNNQNLALGKPVSAPQWTQHRPIWHKNYLTDGYMPYTEPSVDTDNILNGSRIFVPPRKRTSPSITLDLGQDILIDEVRLYPIQMDRNFSVFHRAAMGFPKQFIIEISSDAAFTSSKVIFDTANTDYPSPGHRLACFAANSTLGRFVRITAKSLPPHPRKRGSIFAFAEIEVISNGVSVSQAANITFTHPVDMEKLPPSMLVDGISANGTIITVRSWLEGLAERNRLEYHLLDLQAELQNRYSRQTKIVQALKWGIGMTLLITLFVYLWQRLMRQRHIYQLRENLAADLHDEIGGNFSGIALLSDELAQEGNMPKEHLPQLSSIAEISRISATNARSLVRFLESRNVTGELLREMRATAEMLLAAHQYSFDVDGYKYISKLAPKDKWHLLLFFKESLNNIIKHAEATEVTIHLQLTAKLLTLKIQDNGQGLSSTPQQPAHLTMRAQKLKAHLEFSTPSAGGTLITLKKKL
ncbi:histidine kinase [Rubritalea sp.]|uniref:histidine kinase n=1 Tax=Rubritalea sp. TaxID=2109375 RepID=UPI003F4AAC6B